MKSVLKIITILSSIYYVSNTYAEPLENFSITYINHTDFDIKYANDDEAVDWSSPGNLTGQGVLPAGQSVTFANNIHDHYDGGFDDPDIDYIDVQFTPVVQQANQWASTYWISLVNPSSSPSSFMAASSCNNALKVYDLDSILKNYTNGQTQDGFIENSFGPTNSYTIEFTGWKTASNGSQTLAATLSLQNGVSTNTYFNPCPSNNNNNNDAAAVAN